MFGASVLIVCGMLTAGIGIKNLVFSMKQKENTDSDSEISEEDLNGILDEEEE